MPSMCRCYVESEDDLIIAQQQFILDFLQTVLDAQIRQFLPTISLNTNSEEVTQKWLESLINKEKQELNLPSSENKRLKTAFDNWTLPIQDNLITSDYFSIIPITLLLLLLLLLLLFLFLFLLLLLFLLPLLLPL